MWQRRSFASSPLTGLITLGPVTASSGENGRPPEKNAEYSKGSTFSNASVRNGFNLEPKFAVPVATAAEIAGDGLQLGRQEEEASGEEQDEPTSGEEDGLGMEEEGGVFEMEQTVNISLATPFTTQLSDSEEDTEEEQMDEGDEDADFDEIKASMPVVGLTYTRNAPMPMGSLAMGTGAGGKGYRGSNSHRFLSRSLPVQIPNFGPRNLLNPRQSPVPEAGEGDDGAAAEDDAFIPPHTFVEQQEERNHRYHIRPGKSVQVRDED